MDDLGRSGSEPLGPPLRRGDFLKSAAAAGLGATAMGALLAEETSAHT